MYTRTRQNFLTKSRRDFHRSLGGPILFLVYYFSPAPIVKVKTAIFAVLNE